jgi:hypothetical protein
MSLTYTQIVDRLEQIEIDFGERQEPFAEAAERFHKLTREYELRLARAMVAAQGKTATEKKAQALIAIAASDDSLYQDLKEAEGDYEGARAAVRVLENRSMIGMSLLKGASREPSGGVAPGGQMFAGARG